MDYIDYLDYIADTDADEADAEMAELAAAEAAALVASGHSAHGAGHSAHGAVVAEIRADLGLPERRTVEAPNYFSQLATGAIPIGPPPSYSAAIRDDGLLRLLNYRASSFFA